MLQLKFDKFACLGLPTDAAARRFLLVLGAKKKEKKIYAACRLHSAPVRQLQETRMKLGRIVFFYLGLLLHR